MLKGIKKFGRSTVDSQKFKNVQKNIMGGIGNISRTFQDMFDEKIEQKEMKSYDKAESYKIQYLN